MSVQEQSGDIQVDRDFEEMLNAKNSLILWISIHQR